MATLHRYSKKIRKPISSNGKCGDITYCVQVGKRVYALNCIYCPQICLQWDMFINHMENDHYDDLNTDSGQPMESEEMDLQIEPARKEPSVTLQRNQTTPLVSSNKSEASDHCSFNDPLEDDNSNNLMSLESSIKIENPDYPSDQPAIDDTNSFHCDKIGIDKSDFEMEFNTQLTANEENQAIKRGLRKDIREIKKKLETNNRLMQQLFVEIKLIQDSHMPLPSSIPKILPKTPFESKEEFLQFEESIQQSQKNFSNLVCELKEKANGNSCKYIKNCWRLLIKDEVAKEFCWQGSKDKTEIKNFSTMLAIKISYDQKFTDHKDTEFEKVVIMHFQQAKNRCEKKAKYQFGLNKIENFHNF